MAKRGRRALANGRSGPEQYFTISYPMAHSDAWRSLNGSAVKVWIELRTRFHGGNNGRLTLSLEEAARLLHIGKATAARAFRELETKGFIKLKKRGRWYGRLATEWAVTDKGVNGEAATNDWKRWREASSLRAKTEIGSDADPWAVMTGPSQNRTP
jgi:DNA-binding transcriptional MocR family regulator